MWSNSELVRRQQSGPHPVRLLLSIRWGESMSKRMHKFSNRMRCPFLGRNRQEEMRKIREAAKLNWTKSLPTENKLVRKKSHWCHCVNHDCLLKRGNSTGSRSVITPSAIFTVKDSIWTNLIMCRPAQVKQIRQWCLDMKVAGSSLPPLVNLLPCHPLLAAAAFLEMVYTVILLIKEVKGKRQKGPGQPKWFSRGNIPAFRKFC